MIGKQVWREPVGIVSADGAENGVNFGVAECVQQVLRPVLGVRSKRFQPVQRVGQKFDANAVVLQTLYADVQLVVHEALAENAARQADNADGSYHKNASFCCDVQSLREREISRTSCFGSLTTLRS